MASPEGMADAVIRSGGEMEPEQHQRTEKTNAGVLGAESNRAGGAEDSTQNGGRSESGSAGEALLVAAVAAADKVPADLSISSSQRRSSISTADEQQRQQPPSGVLGGPPPLPKPPEDQLPLRRNFQIPRKSREKKGCSFPSPPFCTSLPLHLIHQADLRHLTRLHGNPAVWRRLYWLALARLLGSRFLCQVFPFFPYPSSFLSHFYFVTRMRQNQTKNSS